MKLMPEELKAGMTIVANPGTPDAEEVTLASAPEIYRSRGANIFVVETTTGRLMEFRYRKTVVAE